MESQILSAQLTLGSDDATTDGNTVGADWHEAIGSLDVHRPRPDPCEVGTSQHAHAQRLLVRGVGGSKLLDTAMILTLPRVGVTIIQIYILLQTVTLHFRVHPKT